MTAWVTRPLLVLALVAVASCSRESGGPNGHLPAQVEFNRDVRAVLADNCFACHGRDANKRKGDLRLDVRDSALAERKGSRAIVPGEPDESEMVRRINSTDPEYRMPPPAAKRTLSPNEIALLTRWIAQGAEYQEHWAYLPLQRPDLPKLTDEEGIKNPIDRFVRAQLENHDLEPSPEADSRVLARRVSFDLTGLPPTPEQIDVFAANQSPTAYDEFVDQLLGSQQYGERMAMYWLDLVRFADTNGYNEDQPRLIYLYRDYVINAFNGNMSFKRFTIDQLAGDLLPKPTVFQRVASGYNRLNKVSKENGSQPQEFIAKYAADRVRTTASVWLGATLGCAECHDHKFDPYTAKDFYRFAAYFADIDENPVPPLMKVSMPPEVAVPVPGTPAEVVRDLKALQRQLDQVRADAAVYAAQLKPERLKWEQAASRPAMQVVSSAPPFNLKTWTVKGEGVSIDRAGRLHLSIVPTAMLSQVQRTTLTGGDDVEFLLDVSNLRFAESPARTDWFQWALQTTRHGALTVRVPRDGNVISLQIFIDPDDARSVELGSSQDVKSLQIQLSWNARRHEWTPVYGLNGAPAATLLPGGPITATNAGPTDAWIETLALVSLSATPSALAESAPPDGEGFAAVIDRVLIRRRDSFIDPPPEIAAIRAVDPAARTADQRKMLEQYYLAHAPAMASWNEQIDALEVRMRSLERTLPHSLVTQATTPRVTRVLHRGDWQDESGEIVAPGVPAFLPALPANTEANRLALARWIVSPDNPLTARTLVNRLWAMFMGRGIVRTLDDLGAQGAPPTHPELLDWLAAELVASNWDVKHVVRLIVTSATYRQSSKERADMHEIDAENLWYARQTPRRLDAEMIRDNALAVSGLLSRDIGGPSVRPYQPDGYATNVSRLLEPEYKPSSGRAQYRRGLYTYWKRNNLHPSLLVFDAPTREECTAERSQSNTPLQALLLLNDPSFVEAARVLAEHGLRQAPSDRRAQVRWAYRRVLGRDPDAAAAATLDELYEKHLARYGEQRDNAERVMKIGNAPVGGNVDASELAAFTSVCRVLLNLHETITRY